MANSSGWDWPLTRRLNYLLTLLCLVGAGFLCLGFAGSLGAQPAPEPSWEGEWVAEGTLFRIAVSVENAELSVTQIESLGFVWSSGAGEVDGSVMRIPVQYAGVTGLVQAELVDAQTAVAFAASCMPEFMVVCALAQDRQAVFKKVSPE